MIMQTIDDDNNGGIWWTITNWKQNLFLDGQNGTSQYACHCHFSILNSYLEQCLSTGGPVSAGGPRSCFGGPHILSHLLQIINAYRSFMKFILKSQLLYLQNQKKQQNMIIITKLKVWNWPKTLKVYIGSARMFIFFFGGPHFIYKNVLRKSELLKKSSENEYL